MDDQRDFIPEPSAEFMRDNPDCLKAEPDKLPVIQVHKGELPFTVDLAEHALLRASLGLYQRGPFLVRMGTIKVAISDNRTTEAQSIVTVGENGLREMMMMAAGWEKYDSRAKEYVRIDAPMSVVNTYLERKGLWRLPVLTGVINAPTIRSDGSILDQPGYDARTGLLFEPEGKRFPPIPDRPTRDDAMEALGVLKDMVSTFPFVGNADPSVSNENRSVMLSGMLTACVRHSIPTAPLHGFTAPLRGSGKTKLADILSVMATGREAGVIAQGKTEEETEKRLGSLLLAGETVIAIDNCENPLGGEFVCQALTQTVVRTRILGKSETPELPSNALITATGNNLTFVGDIVRRALLAQLDAGCESPELREFDFEPVQRAKERRGELVVAALTIIRAFHVVGQPKQATPLGSFEAWSHWVRDALVWLGEADPVETMQVIRDNEPGRQKTSDMFAAWHDHFKDQSVTVAKVIKDATMLKETWTNEEGRWLNEALREALLNVAGDHGNISSDRLGRWLRSNRGVTLNGMQLVREGMTHGSPKWQITKRAAA